MVRLSVLLLAAFAMNATADIYRWVDEEGVVQFGDRPPSDGAEKIKLPPSSTYKPRQLPSALVETDASGEASAESGDIKPYTRVEILKPAKNDTVRDNNGRVELQVALEPPLQEGHRMAVLVDGRSVFDQLTTTQVALSGVERGTHNIQIKILSADGSQVDASESVPFHLHRATVLRPTPAPLPVAPRG